MSFFCNLASVETANVTEDTLEIWCFKADLWRLHTSCDLFISTVKH